MSRVSSIFFSGGNPVRIRHSYVVSELLLSWGWIRQCDRLTVKYSIETIRRPFYRLCYVRFTVIGVLIVDIDFEPAVTSFANFMSSDAKMRVLDGTGW